MDSLVLRILEDRPIAYHPDIAKAVGSVQSAILLCQLLYWAGRGHDEEWIYKTQKEIYEETGLSRWEQETARRKLRELGIIEERRMGVPPRIHFRINEEKLFQLLSHYYEEVQDG